MLATVSSMEKDTPQVTPRIISKKKYQNEKRQAEDTRARAVLNFADVIAADKARDQEEENEILYGSDKVNEPTTSKTSGDRTHSKLFPEAGPTAAKVAKVAKDSEVVAYLKEKTEVCSKYTFSRNSRNQNGSNQFIQIIFCPM